jgi:CheY-like chemotaxis protein
MAKLAVSQNSELLRHLSSSPLKRLALDVVVASSASDVIDAASDEAVVLVLVDVEMPGLSGYEVCRRIKAARDQVKVVLVMGHRLDAEQMRLVTESGCDEVLIAPMEADQLYDVVATQLGLPRRGSERFAIDLAVVTDDGDRAIDGRVTNLSIDGARIVLPEPMGEGTSLRLAITRDDFDDIIEIGARVAWAQSREDSTVIGAAFDDIDEDARRQLSRLIKWEIVEDTQRMRVVIKGALTEATDFSDLQPAMVGAIDFDLSQVDYINSLGVSSWIELLDKASIRGYQFHACSVPFVLQASLSPEVLGRGTVSSFFAPYHCAHCGYAEERLLQSATILAAEQQLPPTFGCPSCSHELELDDAPERFLAFLRDR